MIKILKNSLTNYFCKQLSVSRFKSMESVVCDFSNIDIGSEPESQKNSSSHAATGKNIPKNDNQKILEMISTCPKVDFPILPKPSTNTQFRNRPLVDESLVFDQNAWDNVEWDDEMKEEAISKVERNSSVLVDEDVKTRYESEAADFWDKFYGIHKNKFFKQRNWLLNEFPDLQSPRDSADHPQDGESSSQNPNRDEESFPGENSGFRVLEVGCGNGSTVFPLLSANKDPNLFVYCCDFSPAAVEVVRTSPDFETKRCFPFVWDVTNPDAELPFPPGSLRVITLIFVLSAISPEKFDQAIRNLTNLLEPGGVLLFRDYGLHDMVQLRIPQGRCISQNFYARGDGTRVYFFTEDEVISLFEKQGLEKQQLFIDRRLQVNRLKGLKMFRIWIQAKFIKK